MIYFVTIKQVGSTGNCEQGVTKSCIYSASRVSPWRSQGDMLVLLAAPCVGDKIPYIILVLSRILDSVGSTFLLIQFHLELRLQ